MPLPPTLVTVCGGRTRWWDKRARTWKTLLAPTDCYPLIRPYCSLWCMSAACPYSSHSLPAARHSSLQNVVAAEPGDKRAELDLEDFKRRKQEDEAGVYQGSGF